MENTRTYVRLLGYIRGVNLDLLWSRASGNVVLSLGTYKKSVETKKGLGISPCFEFSKVLLEWMGKEVRSDMALDYRILKIILNIWSLSLATHQLIHLD